MRIRFWAASALAVVSYARGAQLPLGPSGGVGALDSQPIYIELGGVSAASPDTRSVRDRIAAATMLTGTHAVLTHSEVPEVSVRMKRIHAGHNATGNIEDPEAFCDAGVTSWSGYIDSIDGKSLFFYFFESRSAPLDDPVLLWTNGGPGCSSQLGLFMELGPCRVTPESKHRAGPPINATEYNPYSWNERANTIFIDQPVGVGYSYSRYGVEVGESETGAKDVARFLRIFFEAFPEFHKAARKAGFHLSGESYAGRYLPAFAAEIVDQNSAVEHSAWKAGVKVDPKKLIPLRSVLIGNGLSDVSTQFPSYYEYACTRKNGLHKPILDIASCTRMKVYADRCAADLTEHCSASYNPDRCSDAASLCEGELTESFFATGRNPYDISDPCRSGIETLCYSLTDEISAYLDRADVRKLVGAESIEAIGQFQSCNSRVLTEFYRHRDPFVDNRRHLALLLESGVRLLIYNGDLDFLVNYVGHQKSVDTMQWGGQAAFLSQPLREWIVNGQPAGLTRSADGLTWATVYRAGHMVPWDKPIEAQVMLHRWLADQDL